MLDVVRRSDVPRQNGSQKLPASCTDTRNKGARSVLNPVAGTKTFCRALGRTPGGILKKREKRKA